MPRICCQCGHVLWYKPEQGGETIKCPACSAPLCLPAVENWEEQSLPAPDYIGPPFDPPISAEYRLRKAEGEVAPEQKRPKRKRAPFMPPFGRLTRFRRPRRAPVGKPPASFTEAVKRALSCPFGSYGVIDWIIGSILLTALCYIVLGLIELLQLGLISKCVAGAFIFFGVSIGGYIVSFLKNIIVESAKGGSATPELPDLLTSFASDILFPFFHLLIVVFIAASPALVLVAISPVELTVPVFLVMLLAVVAYGPMGLLCVVIKDGVGGLNQVLVIRAIFSVPKRYLVVVTPFMLVALIEVLGGRVLAICFPVPVLNRLLQQAASFYLLLVGTRLLGLLYYTSQDRLDWLTA